MIRLTYLLRRKSGACVRPRLASDECVGLATGMTVNHSQTNSAERDQRFEPEARREKHRLERDKPPHAHGNGNRIRG